MVCQLAVAVHGAWPFQECDHCHKHFRLAPGVNRADRRTCSATCKQYLYHHRVARASELYAQGRTFRQIVQELNVKPQGSKSSIAIVKTWVQKSAASSSGSPQRPESKGIPKSKRSQDR
jgi:hypothetical protein